ncbi:hypothetical protein KFE98_16120 [bacterium SCSIO 12741]|nr:hypothetical protein KFE98_16120 [bacterium SCSIO 12741]
MTTLEFWSQEMFLDATGKTKIIDYLSILIKQFQDSGMDVPPDLDKFLIETLESMEKDLGIVKFVVKETNLESRYDKPISEQ